MSNNKQSSVDFYRIESQKLMIKAIRKEITEKEWRLLENKLGEQVKAMHKEEHRKTYYQGVRSNFQDFYGYYIETFGGNNEKI